MDAKSPNKVVWTACTLTTDACWMTVNSRSRAASSSGVQMEVGLMCRGPCPGWSCGLQEVPSLDGVNSYPMIAIVFPAGSRGDDSVPHILRDGGGPFGTETWQTYGVPTVSFGASGLPKSRRCLPLHIPRDAFETERSIHVSGIHA